MTVRLALQLNAVVGLVTSALAAATIWLLLTRPTEMAMAVANHQYGAMITAVGRELGGWLHALLWYL